MSGNITSIERVSVNRPMPGAGRTLQEKEFAALRARVVELEKELAETQAASGTRIDALTARIDYLNELAPSQALKEAAESKAREKGLRKAVGAYIEWYETDPSLIHNTNARVLVEIITPKLKAAIAERPAPPKEVR
jgi:hypothetical protein